MQLPSALRATLNEILATLPQPKSKRPVHPLYPRSDPALHISLSQPLALRRSQISSFKDELASRLRSRTSTSTNTSAKRVESGVRPFRLSLAGRIKVYYNTLKPSTSSASARSDSNTGHKAEVGVEASGGRAFMALRVGAGTTDVSDSPYHSYKALRLTSISL